jgi:sulfite reductase (NADPH) flavoprotein alpha-component
MLRQLHSLPGLIGAILIIVLAISGAVLSIQPAMERLQTNIPNAGQMSVGSLAGRVAQYYPGAEQIRRTPSGSIIVYYSNADQTGADVIDPLSGQALAPYEPSAFSIWVKDLHRSLLLDTPGRITSGVGALLMLLLGISGTALLARRLGGWRHLFCRLRGNWSQRWHAEVGRFVLLGLLLSSLSGIYMSGANFGLITDGMQSEPDFPSSVSAGPKAPVATLPALLATDLNDLRELVYPNPKDPSDFYSLRTDQGDGYLDQSNGTLLSFQAHNTPRRAYELIYQLHTGEGFWWLSLFLGLCALGVVLMSGTGVLMWWQRRQAMPRLKGNSPAQQADTLILVGSENNSTWGFAQTLHDALRQAGLQVHTAPMNQLARHYRQAQRIFVLTATYGDGDAPASAQRFLDRLATTTGKPELGFAVLGFGDRQFPQFCQFAKDTEAALLKQDWPQLLALDCVDRQSVQEFARWGTSVGQVISQPLTLLHTPKRPHSHALQLLERVEYGEQVQAPTTILRFSTTEAKQQSGWWQRLIGSRGPGHFEAGDLLGVLPPGSPVPRFYSLASGTSDGVLEICVRQHANGLCSGFLHELQPGDQIEAFIQPNPDFRPAAGSTPVILIGAGTGIAPLAGFIRNNRAHQPMHLYWGGRDPASDFLYEPELKSYLEDHRLTQLQVAFSRVQEHSYVHERLRQDAQLMRGLIEKNAQVLVCGSRAMAKNVMQALDDILIPLHLSVLTLKQQGRYHEDVY